MVMRPAPARGTTTKGTTIRIGTRGSELALAQSRLVGEALTTATGRPFELVRIRTSGDVDRSPLAQIGGTGVFVTAVREALVDGTVDVAVHSFKDLPTAVDDRVHLAAVPHREDPADALCAAGGQSFAGLPAGARIGTGSPRRAAQLLRLRPDVRPVAIRGNITTRLAAAIDGTVDAVVLARAGLVRLGRQAEVSHVFAPAEMLPAPAQGALAVECRAIGSRSGDEALAAELAVLDDEPSRQAATAERAVLAGLQAGCSAPVGALALVHQGMLTLRARVVSVDGARALDFESRGAASDADQIGRAAADALLADGAAGLMGR